jgi:DNA-binding transcriptional regulator YiaG
MKPSLADRVLQTLESFTEALETGEKISERFTCRRIELDLSPTQYDSEKVKAVRELLAVSQAVFAKLLGVRIKTVCAWEQGINRPSDMACRFMDEISLYPDYWRKRLKESTRVKKSTAGP